MTVLNHFHPRGFRPTGPPALCALVPDSVSEPLAAEIRRERNPARCIRVPRARDAPLLRVASISRRIPLFAITVRNWLLIAQGGAGAAGLHSKFRQRDDASHQR